MGFLDVLVGRRPRRYSTSELKELGVLDDGADGRSRKKSGSNEFIENMRQMHALEAEMREREKIKESELLEKFTKMTERDDDGDSGGGVADALFMQLVGKALNKQAPAQTPLSDYGVQNPTQTPQIQPIIEKPTIDPSDAQMYAEQIAGMIPKRYIGKVAEEMNALSDADVLEIGRGLRSIFSKGGR